MNSSHRIFRRIVILSRSIAWMIMAWMLTGLVLGQTSALWAQSSNRFSLPGSLQGLAGQDDVASQLRVTGRIELTKDGTLGMLRVTARPGFGWHIYSVTQQDGGPMRTEVVLDAGSPVEVVGPFTPDHPPKVHRLEFFDVPVEEHHEAVTWSAPIRVVSPAAGRLLEVRGRLDGQICEENGGCVPLKTLDTGFVAKVEGTLASPPQVAVGASSDKRRTPPVGTTQLAAASVVPTFPTELNFALPPAEGFRSKSIHVTLQGGVQPATAAPGQTVQLKLIATPDPGWHVYAHADRDLKAISKPTLIAVVEPAGWHVGAVEASAKPVVKSTGLPSQPEERYHDTRVAWRVPITVPADAGPGPHEIRGVVGYQTCSDTNCDMPTGAYFAATITVGQAQGGTVPLRFAPGNYRVAANYLDGVGASATGSEATGSEATTPPTSVTPPIDFDLAKIEPEKLADESVGYILLIAFFGGFLLNFMPCVLPVIGLKIMSFVQQAGEHRRRVFELNVWYSLGMLSIFWLLATLASAASLKLSDESLGWGEQFNYDGFTIPLLCVVFVMGLSFLGIWEIPIPGFVGGGTANQLAQREGLAGAFFKGVLTTILATPCSGPGLATALTWSATKPPGLVYLVFTAMGIGMAAPYLLIGAFPRLVRFIPKPGAWMDTFKQLMGFVLMGTVVYMFTLISQAFVLPTLALIFALWASCWWIGRTPVSASFLRKLLSWTLACGFAALIGWFAFVYEKDMQHELPWQEFSLAALDKNIEADRTVLVDFTARWCPTCKVLERSVLNTRPIRKLVDKNEVVTLVADWSDGDPEIEEVLEALGSKQLPVIAIFPAGEPYRPKTLTGMYTRKELTRKLQAAGPSRLPRLAAESRR